MNAVATPIATSVKASKPAKSAKPVKPVMVAGKNAAAVVDLLSFVNGGAVKHAYTTYAQIHALASEAEYELDCLKLPLSLRSGAVWTQTSGKAVSKSYGNLRDGTRVKLTRRSTGWILEATAATVFISGGGKGKLSLTKAQLDAAIERIMARISVLPA